MICCNRLPGVADATVIGVPHPDFGEGVAAVVVPQAEARLDERQMQTALAGELAKYKLPKRIFFAEALPLNAMGKVHKNELRKLHKGTFASVAE